MPESATSTLQDVVGDFLKLRKIVGDAERVLTVETFSKAASSLQKLPNAKLLSNLSTAMEECAELRHPFLCKDFGLGRSR